MYKIIEVHNQGEKYPRSAVTSNGKTIKEFEGPRARIESRQFVRNGATPELEFENFVSQSFK